MADVTATESGMKAAFRIDEAKVRGHVDRVVRESVEQTLNGLLDAEAAALWVVSVKLRTFVEGSPADGCLTGP